MLMWGIGLRKSREQGVGSREEKSERRAGLGAPFALLLTSRFLERCLEEVPESLVVDLVVVLDLGCFDEGSELAGAAVG